jgi:hypothetical protein
MALTIPTLEEAYEMAKREAKKTRDSGFVGRVVLPGEMNFQDFKSQYNPDNPSGAVGFNPAFPGGIYTAVQPRDGNEYRYTSEGVRYQVPIGSPPNFGIPEMPRGPAPTPQPTLTDPSEFIQAQVGARVNQPFLPQGTAVTPGLALQTPTTATMQTTPGLTGDVAATVPTVQAPTIQAQDVSGATQVSQQPQVTAPQYQAVTGQEVPLATAAQGTVSQPMVAAQEDITSLPPEATVQGQLANISQAIQTSVDEGKPLPAYAQGAKRIVDAAMQRRGLGSSSIAAEALAQGILNASVPIAKADADTYKAAIFANLNNRQQAAVMNAQSYLKMDMQNLSNSQQVVLANAQLRQQRFLGDQSAENASRQFNAVSQKQTDQFFANLSNQINTSNASRSDAMNQFATAEKSKVAAQNANNQIAVNQANAQREAAISQFNAQLKDQRQRFNIENQRVIDQSNVAWRRQINTANTAAINAANQTDAANLLNISNFAMSSLWQQWRDEASWVNQASENADDRAHNLALAALDRDTQLSIISAENTRDLSKLIGKLIGNIFQSELFS